MTKGTKKNRPGKTFEQRGKEFDQKHIEGEFPQRRKNNHVGNFHEARYKTLNDEKGQRITGTYDGQKKAVARNTTMENKGSEGNGEIVTGPAMVTGQKDGKNFIPHHLDGELTKIKNKEYKDQEGRQLFEAESSESAEYAGNYIPSEEKLPLEAIHEDDNMNSSCKDQYNASKGNDRNRRGGGGGGGGGLKGGSEAGRKGNGSSRGGADTKSKGSGSKTTAKESYSKATKNEKRDAILRATFNSGAQIGVSMVDNVLQKKGICYQDVTGTKGNSAAAEVHVDELLGLKVLGAGARASEKNACAGISATPVKASAFAGASVCQASADAYLIEEIEVGARATMCEANASATVGVTGIHVGAGARYARAEAGMKNTPLQAHVEVAGAGAEAGASWQYTGASAGAHLGEAKAGPFGARLGFKFGGGIRNGIPEVDLGPVTVPACCVM